MTKQNEKNANTPPGADEKKAIADPRLKPIVKLIETQLMPVKEVLADFAKAMLDNTITLENRIKSFEKYSPRTLEDTPNEPQEPNEPSFIPRSARVKLELNYSKALANDTEIIRLKRELEECKKDFTTKVTKVFQTCAEIELKHYKEERVKTFLAFTLKITEALLVFERIERPMVTTLNTLHYSIRTVISLLRKIKYNIPLLHELNFFRNYLKMNEPDVKEILIKNFYPSGHTFTEDIERTESELETQEIIEDKLINLILPITIELQSTIDKENRIKKAASILCAKFKSAAITTATEATAIAVEEISTGIANTNMEQHINKMIEAAIKKHTVNTPKNSQGSKSPRTSLPKNKKQGKDKKKNGQQTRNKQKSSPSKNKNNGEIEKEKQQKQKQTEAPSSAKTHQNHQKHGQKRKRQNNKRQNSDHQEGKKKEGRKENGRKNKKQRSDKNTN